MNRNHIIKFVVTKYQKQQIELDAQNNGYTTLSGYIRGLLLNHNTYFIDKFNKLYEKMMRIENG